MHFKTDNVRYYKRYNWFVNARNYLYFCSKLIIEKSYIIKYNITILSAVNKIDVGIR